MQRISSRRLMACTALAGTLALTLGWADSVRAQSAEAEEADRLTEVVVTGTRIQRPNLDSPSPITAVNEEEVVLQGTNTIESVINRLPQFTVSATQYDSNAASGAAGVNLRNLGGSRVLTLIDGQRMLPTEAVDLNFVPSAVVERIDVLTGGASAVYGSDAVAGVVNFVMKRNIEGFVFDAQYAINQHTNDDGEMRALNQARGFALPPKNVWDGEVYTLNAAFGMNSEDGRGNVTFYGGYRRAEAVRQDQRDFSNCGLNLVGPANEALACGGSSNTDLGHFSIVTPGQPGGAFVNNPDGSRTFVPYNAAQHAWNYGPDNYLQRPDERYTAGAFAHYDLNENVELYGSFMFMQDESLSQIAPGGYWLGTIYDVNCDNPFMSASQATAICGPNAGNAAADGQVLLGYRFAGPGATPRQESLLNTAHRLTFGARGTLGDVWSWDVSYLRSRRAQDRSFMNDVDLTRSFRALQVVNVNGVPTCKSVIDGSDPDCVPFDAFAYNAPSEAAYNYLYVPTYTQDTQEQTILSASLSGDLGEYGVRLPWAEQGVAVALGVERRTESLLFTADAVAQAKGTAGRVEGEFEVTEGFIELDVPLIENAPLAESLSLNLGYRYADHNIVGGNSTWRVSVNYAPTSDVRLRTSLNHAVRAPGISELFAPMTFGNVSGTSDPCAGANPTASFAQCSTLTGVTAAQYGNIVPCPTDFCTQKGGGNLSLKPEEADTLTVGFVVTPSAIPGLSFSADYFHIKVEDYIGTIAPSLSISQCFSTGDPFFCDLLKRDPLTGNLFGALSDDGGHIIGTNLNTGYLETSGFDFSANYRLDLNQHGTVDFAFLGTLTSEQITQPLPGLGSYDCVGLFGPVCGLPNPEWRHTLRATWNLPWAEASLSANWRHFGGTDLASNETSDPFLGGSYWGGNVVYNGSIDAYNYLDLAGTWEVRENVVLRAGVNNIFDTSPEIIDANLLTSFGNGNTYPGVYDPLGRHIFVGVNLAF